jgi:hypothetical protein
VRKGDSDDDDHHYLENPDYIGQSYMEVDRYTGMGQVDGGRIQAMTRDAEFKRKK